MKSPTAKNYRRPHDHCRIGLYIPNLAETTGG